MMNKTLRALSPLVLAVYFFTFTSPALGQQKPSYLVTAPSSVTRGDSFDLTITPVNAVLNLSDITISLPPGLSAPLYPATALSDGSYRYRILTGPFVGSFNMTISIASPSGSPVIMTRTVAVQPTFFDTYGVLILLGSLILVAAFTASSGYR